jgi:hypothetical protein
MQGCPGISVNSEPDLYKTTIREEVTMKKRWMAAFIVCLLIAGAGGPLGAQETIESLEAGKQCVTLTFEGFPSLTEILYPPALGIIFEDKVDEYWRAIDILGWPVTNNPSGSGIAIWWVTDPDVSPPWPQSADIAFEEPISTASLYYASLFDVTIEAFDSDGNFLESITGPLNFETGFNIWDFLDIERYANEIASVRITGGATATMIDDFKFCRTLSPRELSDALIARIVSLFADGILARNQSNALIRKLKKIVTLFEKGNLKAADRMVNAFVKRVDRFVRRGILPEEDGQFLIENALAIDFTEPSP